MVKKCYILNGEIINIGEWDYQKIVDTEGVEFVGNPLPKGAIEQEREFEYSEELGYYESGKIPQPSEIDILKEKNATLEKALFEMAEVQSKEYENRKILENAVLDLANTIAGGK